MKARARAPEVLGLHSRSCVSSDDVGGKGWGLLSLVRIPGIRVPPAFILTTSFFERFIVASGLAGVVARWRNALLRGDRRKAKTLGLRIRQRISEVNGLPVTLGRSLARAGRKLRRTVQAHGARGFPAPFIVRSSATHEDTHLASGAGKYTTVPAVVEARALEHAVLKVWESLFSGAPTVTGVEAFSAAPSMAVVVQQMVASSAAGVACKGRLPDGREGVCVEAVSGLGETLCSGQITPCQWIFDEDARSLLERTVCPQPSRITLLASGGQARQSFPAHLQDRPPFPDFRAREVAIAVDRIARVMGFALDAEFCFDHAGVLHFVQCRPQTGIASCGEGAPATRAVAEGRGGRRLDLRGTCASPGAVSGRLLMVDAGDSRNPEGSNLPIARRLMRPGDLLVTPTVNIGWTEWFPQVAGVITERGGILSHTATLARERGIPAVVGAAHCIRRLKGFLRPRIRKLSAGAWAADRVTFDSVQGLIFDRRMPTRHGPGTRTGPATPTTYFQRRSEWPHFVDDSDGRDWTGKPEYPLSALQFDLYYRAWRIAYRRMGLSETQVPLQVSMVTPDPSMKTARRMGRIRPGVAVPSAPGDYRVVAFPTATLSAMGDRILAGGGGAAIPPLVRRLHRERKAAFHRFASLTARMAREADAFVGYDALFEAYSTAIAFAHLRATFRRRVMGPLLDRAMRSLPKEVAATVERALLLGSQGLGTRASQTRTASIRRLLRWAGRPEIRRELERRLPVEAVVWLERMHPTLYARLVRCAETFKLDRSQSDVMQDGPPLEGWVKMIQEYVAAPPSEVHGPVRMRTWKGFEKEVDRLKELVVRPDPAFDFQSFKEVTLMSWEVPGLTEGERHLQHRCQQGLRKVLLRAEEKLHGTRLLPPARSVFDCGRGELQGLLKRLPRGPRHTQPSQRGGH